MTGQDGDGDDVSLLYSTALQLYQLQVQQFNSTHPSDPWTEKAQASIILFKVSVSYIILWQSELFIY